MTGWLNDWPLRRFLVVAAVLQLCVSILPLLNGIGIQSYPLGILVGLIYVLFLPGAIILRILGIHTLATGKNMIYTVVLSIAFIYFVGALASSIYPALGVSKPLTRFYLETTYAACIFTLLTVCFVRERRAKVASVRRPSEGLRIKWMYLTFGVALVLLCVAGTQIANTSHNYGIMFAVFAVITLSPLMAVRNQNHNYHSLAIMVFFIGLSLLLSHSMISPYISGYDINVEYYYAREVETSGIWDSTIESNANGMLSIVILPSVLSLTSSISIVWIYKIVFQILFALVPTGVFLILRERMSPQTSFLSCLLLMFTFAFYEFLPQLPRQEIAELFVVGVILVILDKNMSSFQRKFLMISFGFGVTLSHYTILYVFLFILGIAYAINSRTTRTPQDKRAFSPAYVLLILSFSILWYANVSGSRNFENIVDFLSQVAGSIWDFGSLETSGAALIISRQSITHEITKYLHVFVLSLIVVGLLATATRRTTGHIPSEYHAIMVGASVFACFAFLASYVLAYSMGPRMEQFVLIMVAPLFVVGSLFCATSLNRLVSKRSTHKRPTDGAAKGYTIICAFLAVFFVFNSGLVYQIMNDNPTSIALGSSYDYPVFSQEEVESAKWLSSHANHSEKILADEFRRLLIYGFVPISDVRQFYAYGDIVEPTDLMGKYVYFGEFNTQEHKVALGNNLLPMDFRGTPLEKSLQESNHVFSSGLSDIFYQP